MHAITADVFFPAVERAIIAVGGHYNPYEYDESTVPVESWETFLRRLQEELGPDWGRIEDSAAPYITRRVSVPYTGPDPSRRLLPVIFRPGRAVLNRTTVLQLTFNPMTL